MNPEGEHSRSRLEIRDLVLVALLAAVGGVLSTYIGYLGNLINRLFGVPFGAGQLIAGLHIVWPLLARRIIGRFGSGTMTGVLKGLIEFLAGGTHGVVIVLVSLVEGLLVDLGFGASRRPGLGWTMLVGAVASASNVFVFQAIYLSGVSLTFILVMGGLSLVSGALFGGYLAWDLGRILNETGLLRRTAESRPQGHVRWRRHVATAMVVLGLLGGAVAYYVSVYDPFAAPGSVQIGGEVEAPYTFVYTDWKGATSVVTAELRGSVSHVPARDYAGVRLADVIAPARPTGSASIVRVIADDGYEARFELAAVLGDAGLLLSLDEARVRLIAAEQDGSLWVRRVTRVVLE